jgi:hypothetical protein
VGIVQKLPVMAKLKRKAQSTTDLLKSPKKRMMEEQQEDTSISPTSRIRILKIDVTSCNGQAIHPNTELGSSDLENIWTQTLGRQAVELAGYTCSKRNKEIKIQYQLKQSMSIRDIAHEQEFNHERTTIVGTDVFRCRIVGLNDVRSAVVGEVVKVTVATPNFDITPVQIIAWMTKFGEVLEDHRYMT